MEPQPVNNQPDFAESTPKDSFTNFSEISYEKTRSSYDQSEIAVKQQTIPRSPPVARCHPGSGPHPP